MKHHLDFVLHSAAGDDARIALHIFKSKRKTSWTHLQYIIKSIFRNANEGYRLEVKDERK